MKQSTAPQGTSAGEEDPRPLDVAMMRDTARRVLALGEAPPLLEDLDKLTNSLRGHISLLVLELRGLLEGFAATDPAACVARVGVEEAWRRLHTTRGFGPQAVHRHAERLARSVNSLCDHYQNLNPVVDHPAETDGGANCRYCPRPSPDVVIGVHDVSSGPGIPVTAHSTCAALHQDIVLGRYDADAWARAWANEPPPSP
ncbi:DUF6415 family natural product biosynthesis protein [Streptomyces vilmorinianum]|uniref:DUF6415 family natural product biosynthesis protein n=1 Tax=Streptomyces vilmorinianum TaxID=3051092 RepID=UPI0010FAFC60|nr:DUF6415 family natural product biosynthesis protein [Streptomyces vilmorinianum]